MEQVRPCAALEQRVTRRIALLAILTLGLVLPAPAAFAHGNQFICARVTIGSDGIIALELTADHGDNPNIADAVQARQVLRECLRIQIGERIMPLEQLGEPHFIDHDRYGPDSPMVVSALAEEGPHRLVTATWQARLPGQRLLFLAKEHTPLDVVMWQAGVVPATGGSRWMLLIAGDRSPEFTVTARPTSWWIAALTIITVVSLGWHVLRRRRPTHRVPPMTSAAETLAVSER